MLLQADGILRASLVAEQATLTGCIVDFQVLEINHVWQRAGFYTYAAARTILFFDLRARANQAGAVKRGTKMLTALCNPGVWVVQRVHHPEDEPVDGFLLRQAGFLDHAGLFPDQVPRGLAHFLPSAVLDAHIPGCSVHLLAARPVNLPAFR